MIFGLVAAAALIVYRVGVHHLKSPWTVAGKQIRAVSRANGSQMEVAAAVDPSNPQRLFAASNDTLLTQIRVYSSDDGGRTWSSRPGPSIRPFVCAWGDPSVAIGRDGRQYVAFTEKSLCASGPDFSPYLVVATRKGPAGRWLTKRIVPYAVSDGFDDKPAIAAAPDGRVYVAWSRLLKRTYQTTVVSSSGDGGRTWSKPRVVSQQLSFPQLVAATTDEHGTLYLAGVDARFGIWAARSADGGKSFTVRRTAPLPGNQAATCATTGKFPIAQQTIRCLGPNPTVSAGRGRVYVTYAHRSQNQSWDVSVAALDQRLRPLAVTRVGPPERKKADQFWPAASVDASTGALWVCFYDTTGDEENKHAWFVCDRSRDGVHWPRPVRVSDVTASPDVLWADAIIFGFMDEIGNGGYPAVPVAGGVAHPIWIDTRDIRGRKQELFSAVLRDSTFSR